jgi:hypothetical protein
MAGVVSKFISRKCVFFLLTVLLGVGAAACSHAQSSAMQEAGAASNEEGNDNGLPDAPGSQTVGQMVAGIVSGTVIDANGDGVEGAVVTLEEGDSKPQLNTDHLGFFQFTSVAPGPFKLSVSANGFSKWVSKGLVLQPNADFYVSSLELKVAPEMTNVEVTYRSQQIAEEQMKAEEKQRVLGVIPNFYVSYVWNAAPLSAGQKFRLATRNALDPVTFVGAAFGAGVQMWQRDYAGYGNGAGGYFTRMAAAYGDGFTSSFFTGAILPSVLHQDPRYFYKGTGSIRSRTLYALSRAVISKGDNGNWQPNYSTVFGNLASASLSNSYYPPANRGGQLVIDNWLIGMASGAIGNIFQEFLIKNISRGVPKGPAGAGTP